MQKQIIMKITIWWQESYKTSTRIWKDSCNMVLVSASNSQTRGLASNFKACIEIKHKTLPKNALFLLLQTPTNLSSIFNSWFLHELKHKVHLSKVCVEISSFDSTSYFCSTKKHDSLTLKRQFLSKLKKSHAV